MASNNSSFAKAFLPGLVIGLIVGGIAGAVLPDLIAPSKLPQHRTTHPDGPFNRDEFGENQGLDDPAEIESQIPDGIPDENSNQAVPEGSPEDSGTGGG